MKINKDSVQNALEEGDLELAIEQILELAKRHDPRLHNELIIIASRFNGLKRQVNSGVVSEESARISTAQITRAVTDYLKKIRPEWEIEVAVQENQEPAKNSPPSQPISNTNPAGPKTILFLSANPVNTAPLRLDEEARRIEEGLRRARQRDHFRLVTKWAVQLPDLRRSFLDESPNFVHFSGHGSELGRIYLEDRMGSGQEVKPEALGNFFKLFKNQVECVLLNACYSEIQANEIVKHIPFVIGMNTAVPDQAALDFSEAFYDAIGAGRDVEFAYELACSAVDLSDLGAENIPVLKKRAA